MATTPAAAATESDTVNVSCDAGITTTLVTLSHTKGAIKYTQSDTGANLNRYNWAVSSNGNSLSKKATTDGGTVTWTGVKASNYTFRTRNVATVDCNWIWPGAGDSSLNYIARTNA